MRQTIPFLLLVHSAVVAGQTGPIIIGREEPIASCEEGMSIRSIALADAVATSLEIEPQLMIAQQDVAESKAAVVSSTAAFLPSIEAAFTNERYTPSNGASPVIVVGNTVLGGAQTKSAYGAINLSWNLWNGGRDVAAYRGARAGVRGASAGLASQLADTLMGILQAEADLYEAEVAVRGETSAVMGLRAILSRADERFRNGHGTTVAIGQARSAELDAEQSLNQTCRTVAEKSATLAQAIGIRLEPRQQLSANDLLPIPIGVAGELDLDGSIEGNPAVIAAQEKVAQAQATLSEARRAFGPTVSFSVRRDYLGQDPDSIWAANHHIAPNDYRFALSVEQPLFPMVREVSQVRKARAELRKAQAGYEEARLNSQTKVRAALGAEHEADASYVAAKFSLTESEQVLSLTQSLFRAGRTDLDNVEHAQMDRDKAQTGVEILASKRAMARWATLRMLQPERFPDLLFEQLHLQVQAQKWRDGQSGDGRPRPD